MRLWAGQQRYNKIIIVGREFEIRLSAKENYLCRFLEVVFIKTGYLGFALRVVATS